MKEIDEVSFFGACDTGKARTNNEDNFIACSIWDGTAILLGAIDGIGGYEGGEVAAEMARDIITQYVTSSDGSDPLNILKQAVTQANNEIFAAKRADALRSKMGCVLSCAIISLDEQRLYMAHIGDSRLYQYTTEGGLRKLSHDHSLVGYREENGMLTEEEAMNHPQRNLIERSLGDAMHNSEDPDFLDAGIFPILTDSQYLFCSDGLSDMLYSAQIESALAPCITPKASVDQLITMANDAGGKDNITAVVAKITFSEPPQEPNHTDEEISLTECTFEVHIPSPATSAIKDIGQTTAATPQPNKKPQDRAKRFRALTIISATSFIVGGALGFFLGRYFVPPQTVSEATDEIEILTDSVTVTNNPSDTLADPQREGKITADSINKKILEEANQEPRLP